MEKTRTGNWFTGFFVAALMIGIPGIIQADVNEVLLKFQPYVSLQEEYTNNINLTPNNKKDAYITTVYTGFSYSTLPQSGTGDNLFFQDTNAPAASRFYRVRTFPTP